MTTDQIEMLEHSPVRETKEPKNNKKRNAVIIGAVIGLTAAYFIGPYILGKVQYRKVSKATTL